jgi:uncharacterized OsmC-like protein
MDPEMLAVLLAGIAICALITVSMILVRMGTLTLQSELEEKSLRGAN